MKFLLSIKNQPAAVKASLVYIFASLLTQGLSFITTPLFTRILSEQDYGIITVFNSWNSIIGIIAMLALSSGAFNIGMLDYKTDRSGFISSLLALSNLSTLLIFLLYLINRNYFNSFLQLPFSLISLMFIGFLLNPAKDFWLAKNRYELKYKSPFFVIVGTSIIATIFALFAVIYKTDNLGIVKLWSVGLVTLSVSLYFYIATFVKAKFAIHISYWKYALALNLPLIVHTLAKVVMDGSDRIMIGHMIGLQEAGKYGVVATIAMLATILWSAINGSLIPYMFDQMKKEQFDKIDKVIQPLLIFYAFICIFLSFIAPEVLKILAPSQYQHTVYIIPPIAAGIFFTSLYSVFGNIELFYKKTHYIMFATVAVALFNIVLNYFSIPVFGYMAPAYTTMLSVILLAVVHYQFVRHIQLKRINNVRFMLWLGIAVVLICLSCNILYPYTLVRYTLITVFLMVGILNRKKIIRIYQKMKASSAV